MNNVIIIPDTQTEDVCQDAVKIANTCQSDFQFYVIPPIIEEKSPLALPDSNFVDILTYLDKKRTSIGYKADDFILSFYNGNLHALEYGLSNLFMAGSNYEESPSCTGVVSLQYINWGILEEKYNYELQKHSILHLILCGVIGAYTHLRAHGETYGCMLDFNGELRSFNAKLQKGYYLCNENEKNCYNLISKEKYGNSILRLCSAFKKISNSEQYQLIIKEIIMGDKFENISNSTITNRSSIKNARKVDASSRNPTSLFGYELKELIANNQIEQCIEILLNYFNERNDKDGVKSMIMQSSKINHLNQQIEFGVIEKSQEDMERSKINSALVNIIDKKIR